MTPKPRTDKQRQAARANGLRSRGPITARGKYNSSQNATRHGLLVETVVLNDESAPHFLALLDALKQEFEPRTTTQVLLVESMAVARWKLLRVWGAQKTALDRDVALQDSRVGGPAVRIMLALRTDVQVPHELLLRYETTYERQFSRALHRLQVLQGSGKAIETDPYFPAKPSGQTLKKQPVSAKRTQEVLEFTSPNLDLPDLPITPLPQQPAARPPLPLAPPAKVQERVR